MTRFARAGKRKFVEASSWNDLSKDVGSSTESRGDQKKQDSPSKKVFQRKKSGTSEIKRQKQIEARRQRRQKWKCCFVCRQTGHQASACPNKDDMNIGTCFKCGSTDHTTRKCKSKIVNQTSGEFPFAKCFICQEMGHLARACSENPKGLYPQGGGCKICGSVIHLKRDCPELQRNKKKKDNTVEAVCLTLPEGSTQHQSADAQLEPEELHKSERKKKHGKKKEKVVKF